jgi:hypothetical protein
MMRSSRQGADGLTLVLLMAPREQSRGESLTPNISEWPNDAVVCSLSQVLEQTSIPQRFFLSSTACAGILRRAEKRGKQLPTPLRIALTEVAQTAKVNDSSQCASTRGGMGRLDAESETLLPCVAPTIEAVDGRKWGSNQWVNNGKAIVQPISIHPHCIGRAPEAGPQGKEYLMDGSAYCMDSRGQPQAVVQPIPIDTMNMTPGHSSGGLGFGQPGDPSFTLTKGHSHAVAQPVGFTRCDHGGDAVIDGTPTMRCGSNYSAHLAASIPNMAVRRLTPVECERLQGFPDGYTDIKDKCPDGPRYKALGNSWAVPVVRWIGERIDRALA